MSVDVSNEVVKKRHKKALFKRWWFWVLSLLIIFISIAILAPSEDSTAYELSKLRTMTKQQIVEKFGKPDEIVNDEKNSYNYAYNSGFMVSGNDKEALQITLMGDMIKEKSSSTYKIFDVYLGSSFDENVKRLGKPSLNSTKDGKKNAAYLTKEGDILTLSTEYNSDKVVAIEFATYDYSSITPSLDTSKLLQYKATEDEIKKLYDIKDKSSSTQETIYKVEGFNLVVDNEDTTIKTIYLSEKSIYNIKGLTIGDSLEKANELLGKPIGSNDGVKNTTQYSYEFDDITDIKRITLSIDNASKKIGYMEVTKQ